VRRAIKLTSTLIAATAISGGAAVYAVAVSVPADDFSVNLGLLLQAGHRYRFYEWKNVSKDSSDFTVPETELRLYGRVFEKVDYNLRFAGFGGVREAYVGTDFATGFSAKNGRYFVPFGVEATTEEGYLTCTSRTRSSEKIAPGRKYGLRFDYVRRRESWPYEFGAAAGVYNNAYGPLVDGAARVYARPVPGVQPLSIGCSFYYGKEYREINDPRRRRSEFYFRPAPRLASDVHFETWRLKFGLEYLEYFLQDVLVLIGVRGLEPIYKNDYFRGGFATAGYTHPLPWRYLNFVEPYIRYERYDTAVFGKGYSPEDRYTGGFALFFIGRNLMFKANYTRILEEEQRRTNDEIESLFQVMF